MGKLYCANCGKDGETGGALWRVQETIENGRTYVMHLPCIGPFMQSSMLPMRVMDRKPVREMEL